MENGAAACCDANVRPHERLLRGRQRLWQRRRYLLRHGRPDRELLHDPVRGCLGRGGERRARPGRPGSGHAPVRRGLLRFRSAGGGQGSGPVQPEHAAQPDLLPHARRPLLRVGRLPRRGGMLPGFLHPRLELRAVHGLPLRRPGADHARSGIRPRHRRARPDELPRLAAASPGPQLQPRGGGRPDGLRHEDVPRVAALGRRRAAARALARREEGAGLLLDTGRMGRRPGRRHGRLPAQHHGRGVLRPQSPDGVLVPGRPARRGGDGPAISGTTISRGSAGTCTRGEVPGPTRTCSTASTTSTRSGRPGGRRTWRKG